ncbi:uncharacterized protein VTP21DRAFT_1595 [Calcarisporiella thermophila]|uniref:uncharacterized protein n=1 Tax=Calcarisporiella thermophila TaxID=911321 RepID=UPI00374461F1
MTSTNSVEVIRQDYQATLADLTFNSKPIIDSLTILAQENKFAAPAIAQAVEERIYSAHPTQKLPALYLLDSICKNVGGAYINIFSRSIRNLFMDTYSRVDPQTRRSMEKLLGTWRSWRDGRPVFAYEIIDQIERSMHELRGPGRGPSLQQSYGNAQTAPPFTSHQNSRITSAPTYPTSTPLASQAGSILSFNGTLPDLTSISTLVSSAPAGVDPSAWLSSLLLNGISGGLPTSQPIQLVQPTQSAPSTPIPQLAQSAQIAVEKNPTELTVKDIGIITFSNADLQKRNTVAITLLYESQPLQCKQCGFRYPNTPAGKAQMDEHLDWHFRQNRRTREKKRGQSRTWFALEEQWIKQRAAEGVESQAPIFEFDNKPTVDEDSSVQEQASKVIVPESDPGPCPICHEKFRSVWSDADEEWMYLNAVELNGKIYHATCYSDASRAGTTVTTVATATISVNVGDEENALKRKAEDDTIVPDGKKLAV